MNTHTHKNIFVFETHIWILYLNVHLDTMSKCVWIQYANAHLDTISKPSIQMRVCAGNACVCKTMCVRDTHAFGYWFWIHTHLDTGFGYTRIWILVLDTHAFGYWFCTHTHFPHTHAFGYWTGGESERDKRKKTRVEKKQGIRGGGMCMCMCECEFVCVCVCVNVCVCVCVRVCM